MSAPIYLDHNATTPLDPRVVEAMVSVLRESFGNPSSRHVIGDRASQLVQSAQKSVATLIGARPPDVFFTSGATESNNLVFRGAAARRRNKKNVVISVVEHPSVLEPARALELDGVEVRLVPVGSDGLVTRDALEPLLDKGTFLVSIMFANNEVGVINPVRELSDAARSVGALFHCDATQAVGHVPVDVSALGIDLMSFSAHKMYGPKGAGALYAPIRSRRMIEPTILGGGHQRGFRSGTLNVPGIVGFGAAASIAVREMANTEAYVQGLRDLLLELLRTTAGDIIVNGSLDSRLAGNLSVSLPGVDAEVLTMELRDLASFSTGAACSSAKVEPSHVLLALEEDTDRAYSSVRFGIGKGNTEEEIRAVASAIGDVAGRLRRMRVGRN